MTRQFRSAVSYRNRPKPKNRFWQGKDKLSLQREINRSEQREQREEGDGIKARLAAARAEASRITLQILRPAH
jgi:hypothetical protein